jgi:hypothetical protein
MQTPTITFEHPVEYTLSVIVPVLKYREGLARCLASVKKALDVSSPYDCEVVIKDSSGEPEVDTLRYAHGFIKKVVEPVPMPESWNQCLAISRGRYIHIMHDDDYVRENFYKRLMKMLTYEPLAVAVAYEIEDQNGTVIFENRINRRAIDGLTENMVGKLEDGNCLSPSGVVISREAYEAVGGYTAECLDWFMYLRVAEYGRMYWNREGTPWRVIPEFCLRATKNADSDGEKVGAVKRWTAILDTIKYWEGVKCFRMPARDHYANECLKEALASGDSEVFKLAREIGMGCAFKEVVR